MASLLYILTRSTDEPDRAATALRTALAAQRAGHDVSLWLSGEGVRLGVKGVAETLREPGPESATEMVEALVAGGAPLLLEALSFETREFALTALRTGAEVVEAARLAEEIAGGRAAVSL
jgi:predicted peroxiredoxin